MRSADTPGTTCAAQRRKGALSPAASSAPTSPSPSSPRTLRSRQRKTPPRAANKGTSPQCTLYSQFGANAAEAGTMSENQLGAGIPLADANPGELSGRLPWPTSSRNGRSSTQARPTPTPAAAARPSVLPSALRQPCPPRGRSWRQTRNTISPNSSTNSIGGWPASIAKASAAAKPAPTRELHRSCRRAPSQRREGSQHSEKYPSTIPTPSLAVNGLLSAIPAPSSQLAPVVAPSVRPRRTPP